MLELSNKGKTNKMHDFLKNIAEENDWSFEYARTDYQNLYDDIETERTYLFVDPITTDSKFSSAGNETLTYSGKLFLLLSSDVDEEYSNKYVQYIKPLFEDARNLIIGAFACSQYEVNIFKTTEVINLFDQNLDGLLINYSVTYVD